MSLRMRVTRTLGPVSPGEEGVHVRGAYFFGGLAHATLRPAVGAADGEIVQGRVGGCRDGAAEAAAAVVLPPLRMTLVMVCSFEADGALDLPPLAHEVGFVLNAKGRVVALARCAKSHTRALSSI